MSYTKTIICVKEADHARVLNWIYAKGRSYRGPSKTELTPPVQAFLFHTQGSLGLCELHAIEYQSDGPVCHAKQLDRLFVDFGELETFPLTQEIYTIILDDAKYAQMYETWKNNEEYGTEEMKYERLFA